MLLPLTRSSRRRLCRTNDGAEQHVGGDARRGEEGLQRAREPAMRVRGCVAYDPTSMLEPARQRRARGKRSCTFRATVPLVFLSWSSALMNDGLWQDIPDALSAQLKPAEVVYYPLVICLRAYAAGKSPFEMF